MASKTLRGRVELVVGRLGAGKTSWAGVRVRELGRASGRPIATTGIGWGDEWTEVSSLEALDALRDHVLLWDEIHLWCPSVRGMANKVHQAQLLKVLSLARKRDLCIVGTTQAYTRVGTEVRHLCSSTWWPQALVPGYLHRVQWTTPPEDGRELIGARRWYLPRDGHIPTNAEVFLPPSMWGDLAHDEPAAPESEPAQGRRPRPAQPSSWATR